MFKLCDNVLEAIGKTPLIRVHHIAKGLTLRGFLARMYAEDFAQCRHEMAELIDAGRLTFPLSVHHGLDSAPEALVDLLAGRNLGKVVVDLRPAPAPAPAAG